MQPERIDSERMSSGDGMSEFRGLGLHHQSGIIGQGVYSSSKLKWITHEGKGKPIFLQPDYHIRKVYSLMNGSAILYTFSKSF